MTKALPTDGTAASGVIGKVPAGAGSEIFNSVVPTAALAESEIGGASGTTVAITNAFGETGTVAEAEFAAALEAGVAESETDGDTRSPSAAEAKTDDPKNTTSIAMAILTSLPLT